MLVPQRVTVKYKTIAVLIFFGFVTPGVAAEESIQNKKLLRVGSELVSQLLASPSISDADLVSKVPVWQQTGLDGMVFSIASDISLYSGSTRNMSGMWWNVKDLQPRTYDEFIPDIQAFQAVSDWGNLTDNFLWSSMAVWDTPTLVENQDWFNDDHWGVILNNVGIQSRIAHEVGFKGVLLDLEQYDHHGGALWHHPFNYSEYASEGYLLAGESSPRTWDEVSTKVYQRGRQYAEALVGEYPDITLMMIPAFYRPTGRLGDESLVAPFIDGVVAGLDTNSKLVVGTEYSYNVTNKDEIATIRDGAVDEWLSLSQDPQALMEIISLAVGLQTDGIDGAAFSDVDANLNQRAPKQHQRNVYDALLVSDNYAWLYGETSYYADTTPSPLMQQYFQANINAKKLLPPQGIVLFNESFTGNTFDESGSSLASSNGGIGTEVLLSSNTVVIANLADREGVYTATVAVDDASAYIVEQDISISVGEISENAMLLRAWDAAVQTNVDLLLEAKENGSGWDVEVTHAAGVSMAGLVLSRDDFHTISLVHLGDETNVIELYVDGRYVDNYVGLGAGVDLGYIQIGNVSDATGFSNATLAGFRIYQPAAIPEPCSFSCLLSLIAMFICKRQQPAAATPCSQHFIGYN